ncbi:MAG: pyrroline-5-carboxylate reductase [Thermoanaerobaculia bacterium]|nr:pyrroline-5-carboxylate reductase [Thermoanaerobaculia bacterium]
MQAKIERLAVLGAGKMGVTLLSALSASGVVDPKNIVATARHESRRASVGAKYGVATSRDNRQAVESADVVLLCVKPQTAGQVVEEVREHLSPQQVLLSIVAGLTTEQIEEHLGDREVPVVRAMPNTPSRIGQGMTAVCGGRYANENHLELGRAIFSQIGRSLILEERYFDAVTGLSASGPAFLYIVIEALAEGGVKMGLPRQVATELAAQTCLGAGHMVLETGDHPALLKDEVTTPAGCTMDGILALETGGLRVTLINAVVQAGRRAAGLVDE